eukprot:991489-Pelagomonas_calceolata.AAC.2
MLRAHELAISSPSTPSLPASPATASRTERSMLTSGSGRGSSVRQKDSPHTAEMMCTMLQAAFDSSEDR